MPSTTTSKATQQRRAVWLAWTFSALVTVGFTVLALITFANLIDAKHDLNTTNLNITTANNNTKLESDEFDAALAGTFMAAFLCIAVTVISFLLLAQKSLFSSTRRSTPGFAYAFMTSSFLHTAIFLILVGIILVGIRSEVEDLEGVSATTTTVDLDDGTTTTPTTITTTYWSSTSTAVLITTMIFSFITSGIYIFMFTCMILFRAAVQYSDSGPTSTSTLLAGRMLQSHQLPVTATPTTPTPTPTTTTPSPPPTKRGGFFTSAFHSPPSPRLYDTPSDYVDSVEMARRKQSYGAWGS